MVLAKDDSCQSRRYGSQNQSASYVSSTAYPGPANNTNQRMIRSGANESSP
jgi:hypothetical protein